MTGGNIGIWCCVLFLITSFSKSQSNCTSNDNENDNLIAINDNSVQYEPNVNSGINYDNQVETLQYDLYKNSVKKNIQYNNTQQEYHSNFTYNDDEDDNSHLIQYEHGTRFTQNHEDDNQILRRFCTNSTKIITKRNVTSQEIHENIITFEGKNDSLVFFQNSSKNNIVPYDMCSNTICIQLCCPYGDRLVDNECKPGGNEYPLLPNVHGYTNHLLQSENKRMDELFPLDVYDPCQMNRSLLPEDYNDYMIFANGSLYLYYYKLFVKSTSYCLAVVDEDTMFVITICSETLDEIYNLATNSTLAIELNKINFINMSFHIVSLLCLLPIFLVYSILPELQRNLHSFMLCNFIVALCLTYAVDIVNILMKAESFTCVTIAFFIFFFSMASCFWLSVMSFDMWQIFRGISQRNVKLREGKEIFYVIYAWGIPFILAIICIILDFIPDIPKTFRPRFRTDGCWFGGDDMVAYILYYYGLVSICIVGSICLSISTALKIARYVKDMNYRPTDSKSKCYNDNKKWFNLYLKLFITRFAVLGIKWFLMTVSWLSGNVSIYNSYVINLLDIMQNFCIFVIFVWKKKIKQMLLKRFGCGPFLETQGARNATLSSTCTTLEGMTMQEILSSYGQTKNRAKVLSDNTDL